jgi:transcription elongation factor GreA
MNKQTRKEFVLSQLVRLEECRNELLAAYFPSEDQERARQAMEHWLDRYIRMAETLASQDSLSLEKEIPIVLIGCSVDVEYLDPEKPQLETYTVCFPDEADPASGFISFLSPIGQQLLLTSLNQKVSLMTPDGDLQAVIKTISIPSSFPWRRARAARKRTE